MRKRSRFFSILFLFILGSLTSCRMEMNLEIQGQDLMKKVVTVNPRIAKLVNVSTTEPYEGLIIVESDLMMQDSAANHLFIVKVDLDKGLTLRTSTPNDRSYSPMNSLQTLAKQAEAAEKNGNKVLLGINADVFGRYMGMNYFSPRGAVYVDGENRSTGRGGENLFFITKDGRAHLGNYAEFEKVEEEVEQAVGVWQALVWDGVPYHAEDYPDRNLTVVNPRTFLGLSENARTLWLMVVDGRQPGYSKGFLMEDMVGVCQAVGCYRACNLDGGGSTTMVVRNENEEEVQFSVLNTPSDLVNGKRTARMVVNGLLVVEK